MKIKLYPDKVLREKSKDIKKCDNIEELYKTLLAGMINYRGIGLAAPQIGISKRAAMISQEADIGMTEPLLLINPDIIEFSGEQKMEEACLSVFGVSGEVKRGKIILVETGLAGERKIIEAGGLLATVIQHETDHLNGILFPDRMIFPKRAWKLVKSRIKRKKMNPYEYSE